ncbi:MAG TPA: hypothetical protein VGJ51_09585 [Candidatus Angelobacter sp.]
MAFKDEIYPILRVAGSFYFAMNGHFSSSQYSGKSEKLLASDFHAVALHCFVEELQPVVTTGESEEE